MLYNRPMNGPNASFESFWEDLLSRYPKRVWEAFATLDINQQQVVLEHLERMVNEAGWQPEQRKSAQAALDAIAISKD